MECKKQKLSLGEAMMRLSYCTSKIKEAKRHEKRLYYCKYCGYFHLTSQKLRQMKGKMRDYNCSKCKKHFRTTYVVVDKSKCLCQRCFFEEADNRIRVKIGVKDFQIDSQHKVCGR